MMIYQGSVKNLWAAGTEGRELEFEFSDAYSVFDWGRMPDDLPFKGEALAAIGAHFFEVLGNPTSWKSFATDSLMAFYSNRPHGTNKNGFADVLKHELNQLQEKGLPHHFLSRPKANRLRVKRVAVEAPQAHQVAGQNLYLYPKTQNTQARLIPLEVVFRFGMPAGSSLSERLTSEYAASLGFKSLPQEGAFFPAPFIEFFTKLEDKDRFLTWEQALNYAGLSIEAFSKLVARSLLVAEFLKTSFAQAKLELWDGKFEWAQIGGDVALVDSIGPDELRLIEPTSRIQISKEFLRQVYRKSVWYTHIGEAKKMAQARGETDWKSIAMKELQAAPQKLTSEVYSAAQVLYPSLAQVITGQTVAGAIPLTELAERIAACLGD